MRAWRVDRPSIRDSRLGLESIDIEEPFELEQGLAERGQRGALGVGRRGRTAVCGEVGLGRPARSACCVGQTATAVGVCSAEGQPPARCRHPGGRVAGRPPARSRGRRRPRTARARTRCSSAASDCGATVERGPPLAIRRHRRRVERLRACSAAGCGGPARKRSRRNSSPPSEPDFAARAAGRVAGVACRRCTWPASSSVTGTGGPNIFGFEFARDASIASRTASASSRRTGMRPSRRLSGSIASSRRRPARRLAIGRRGHDQPVQPLQAPAAGHEFGGQPVEQFGMRGPVAERAEVGRRGDEPAAEVVHPDAVDQHARRPADAARSVRRRA